MSASTAIAADGSRTTNPFATRWVRPGALPYQFPSGADAAAVVRQLRERDWRGCIIGPHGSGKSALLATLIPEIERSGWAVRSITLHDGQRHLPAGFVRPTGNETQGVFVVDGYEQLGWRARRQLNHSCRRMGWGLLITAHGDAAAARFPVLFRTSADLATVQQLIERHLPPHGNLIQSDEMAAAFQTHGGNVREAFFALYDLFEQRSRHSTAAFSTLNSEPPSFTLYRL